MVKSEIDMDSFSSLSEAKKKVQNNKIRSLVIKEYNKYPVGKEPNRKKLSKILKISEASISDAFRDTTTSPEDKQISQAIGKALGIATPLLLLEENNIEELSNFLGNNAYVSGALASGVLFWQQFIKPRINDPKNDLSEIEVLLEIMKSRTGQAYVGGIFGIITSQKIFELINSAGNTIGQAFDNFGLAIRDGLINFQSNFEEEIEEITELFKLECIICITTLERFPSFNLWFVGRPAVEYATFVTNPLAIFTTYYSEKKDFIDKCGAENIMLCEDYDNAPPGNDFTKPSDNGEETGEGEGEEMLQPPEPITLPEEISTAPGEGLTAPEPQRDEPSKDDPQDPEGEEIQVPAGKQAGTPGSVGVIPGTGGTKLFDPFEVDPK